MPYLAAHAMGDAPAPGTVFAGLPLPIPSAGAGPVWSTASGRGTPGGSASVSPRTESPDPSKPGCSITGWIADGPSFEVPETPPPWPAGDGDCDGPGLSPRQSAGTGRSQRSAPSIGGRSVPLISVVSRRWQRAADPVDHELLDLHVTAFAESGRALAVAAGQDECGNLFSFVAEDFDA